MTGGVMQLILFVLLLSFVTHNTGVNFPNMFYAVMQDMNSTWVLSKSQITHTHIYIYIYRFFWQIDFSYVIFVNETSLTVILYFVKYYNPIHVECNFWVLEIHILDITSKRYFLLVQLGGCMWEQFNIRCQRIILDTWVTSWSQPHAELSERKYWL